MPPVSARDKPRDMARSPSSPVKFRRSGGSSAYWQAQAKIQAVSAFRTSPAASHAVLLRTRCLFSVISLCPFYLESVGKNIPLWAVSVNRIKENIRKHRFNLCKFAECVPLLPFIHIHFSVTGSSCRFKVAQFFRRKYQAKASLSGFPAKTEPRKHFEIVGGAAAFFCSSPFWHLIFLLAISPGHQLPPSAFAPCKPPGPSVFLVCLPGTAAIFWGAEGTVKGNALRKRFFLILRS